MRGGNRCFGSDMLQKLIATESSRRNKRISTIWRNRECVRVRVSRFTSRPTTPVGQQSEFHGIAERP